MAAVMRESNVSDELRLTEIYDEAVNIYDSLQDSKYSPASIEYQKELRKAIELFESATRCVSVLDLFSYNEDIEEVATTNCRYFLLPAYLGDLTYNVNTKDHSVRMDLVLKTQIYYNDFLERCRSYGLARRLDADPPETDANTEIVRAPNAAVGLPPNMSAMAQQRNRKIKQFQLKKEMDLNLSSLKRALESPAADEELVRKFYLALIQKWINKVEEDLQSLDSEVAIISRLCDMKLSGNTEELPAPPRTKSASSLKPILITRNELQKKVYGLGYPSIPTLSIEDFYHQKVEDGSFSSAPPPQNALQNIGSGVLQAQQQEEDDVREEIEEETDDVGALQHKRDFDDWKDDHRRGCGNRKNMG